MILLQCERVMKKYCYLCQAHSDNAVRNQHAAAERIGLSATTKGFSRSAPLASAVMLEWLPILLVACVGRRLGGVIRVAA
jgi:hypothetical protein